MGITHKRRLRSGTPLWQHYPVQPVPQQSLKRDITCDVLIVGAGISGAMLADQLTEAGLQVCIVDRRGALQGSTPASTALLQYEIDVPLHRLAKQVGLPSAERIWQRSKLALEALRERVAALNIRADCFSRHSLYLEGNLLDEEGLQREAQARREAGFEVTFLSPKELMQCFGIKHRSALLGYGSLSANPKRLAAGFLLAALQRGAILYTPVEVTDVQATRSDVLASTQCGRVLRAKHLIFATGYELPKMVPRKGHQIISTWAMATKPQANTVWPAECLLWEASTPYLYLRRGPGRRLICGGEDELFASEDKRDALLEAKTACLEKQLKALLPHADSQADYAWCGNFGASDTGTPSIGPLPDWPHCYAVLGYGGNGITFSMMAAHMMRSLLTGKGDRDLALFAFR